MQLSEAKLLADKLAMREHTPEELKAVGIFLRNASRSDAEALMQHYFDALPAQTAYEKVDADLMNKLIQLNVENDISSEREYGPVIHRVHFLKRAWFKYAAAAILILGFGVAYLWNTQQKEKPSDTVQTTQPVPSKNDVQPGGNKAVLTLADGRQVILDSATTGMIATQNGSTVTKLQNGKIVYKKETNVTSTSVAFNTMSTPRGGQYQLVLPDSSLVWLNAASSITYPTAFVGQNREVRVTGEVYFEVARNAKHPFIVQTNNQSVAVLGTHFNVRSYDSGAIVTTLLEGKVKVQTAGAIKILNPGQQSVTRADNISVNEKVNVAEIIAWKNGNFYFDNKDLKTILNEFARWYDVDVVYEGTLKNRTFFGIVKRDRTLTHVLQLLKDNNIQYRIEGRQLFVQAD